MCSCCLSKEVIPALDDPTAIVVPEWFAFLAPDVQARITDAEVRSDQSIEDRTISLLAGILDFYAP